VRQVRSPALSSEAGIPSLQKLLLIFSCDTFYLSRFFWPLLSLSVSVVHDPLLTVSRVAIEPRRIVFFCFSAHYSLLTLHSSLLTIHYSLITIH
jgi:hypothetical protein